ncbi:unnamed protein product [Moneuplotes crassus]|uniref:Uncharacterized protein n=1 Tax=Euplotes crassus TaxID=5936 RepID=A0AAD1XQP6_EUPCR|nr:unnamed protein product [Moneuplotes crassus]
MKGRGILGVEVLGLSGFSVEEKVKMKEKEIEFEVFKALWLMIRHEKLETVYLNSVSEIEETSSKSLSFVLTKKKEIDFIESLQPFTLPNFKIINLYKLKEKDKRIKDFLSSSFPHKIEKMMAYPFNYANHTFSYYFDNIIKISYKVHKQMVLSNFLINVRQFGRLITAYKHVQEFGLTYCILSTPVVPNLSGTMKNARISTIDFSYSGADYTSDWNKNSQEFENLIEGLGSSEDLRLSLKLILLDDCGIQKHNADEILRNNRLSKIFIHM